MWPWRRRLEVVTVSSAGDDATAALTMILRYHREPVTLDEVRRAIHGDRTGVPHAGHVIGAAERFHLHGRGLAVDDPRQLVHIPTPSIVHLASELGPFPWPLENLDGFFGVLVSISPRRARWIDPYIGEREGDLARFIAVASGVFLVFDHVPTLPRARLHGTRRDGET
jgi:ABC-type bacteriocin/lantibiotic exporter with double-glycine peptidase domain